MKPTFLIENFWKKGTAVGILIFCILSCQPADPLLATWNISRVTYTPSGLSTPESLAQGQALQAMSAGLQNSTFSLYKEGKSAFFSTKTPYRQGTWKVKENRLILQLTPQAPPYEFEIGDYNENHLVLTLLGTSLTHGEITLLCNKSLQYSYKGIDLLAPALNHWRNKPQRRETKEQIRLRTLAHLDYLIHYFECIEHNRQTFFETGIISSPFVFYAHGLGLSRTTRLARQWQDAYYNKADAQVGFEILREALRSLKKYPKAESYTKEYLLAFKQMRAFFDQ
jgi:hypothetical protein